MALKMRVRPLGWSKKSNSSIGPGCSFRYSPSFSEALAKDPSLEEAWLNLAGVQWYEKGPEQALEACREASETLLRSKSMLVAPSPFSLA